jgi:uncharacterized membrane-anchored protein
MDPRHVPPLSPRYWAGLCLASVFGANLGDFSSHSMNLGHAGGLPALAGFFVALLFAAHRTARPVEAFYWLAIVTLRTAATKLGDLATHDMGVPYPAAMAALALAILATLAAASQFRREAAVGMPPADGFFWLAMFLAGTLGTVAGDYVSGDLGLGTRFGSLVLCLIAAGILVLRARPGLATRGTYWLSVVAIRTAGTTLGDFMAFRHGLGLGLPLSTAGTGLAMLVLLLAWPRGDRLVWPASPDQLEPISTPHASTSAPPNIT